MPTLPAAMIAVLGAFAPLFSARVWVNAQVLLIGGAGAVARAQAARARSAAARRARRARPWVTARR